MPKPAPRLFAVLVLEDDLEVSGRLLLALHKVEPFLAPYDLDVTVLSTCDTVEKLVNDHPERHFDVILMDRDCKMNSSFHVLNFQQHDLKNIISISSTSMWNLEARNNGIVHCVPKSFNDLRGFADRAAKQAFDILLEKKRKKLSKS